MSDRPRAVLVAVQLPGVSDVDFEGDLAELGRLAHTLGLQVVAHVTQRRDSLARAAVLGEGKLAELARWTGGPGEVGSFAHRRKDKAQTRREEQLDEVRAHEGASDGQQQLDDSGVDQGWDDEQSGSELTDEADGDEEATDHDAQPTVPGAAELGAWTEASRAPEPPVAGPSGPEQLATVVVVDHEISPSQARNLERATGATVMDRTGVIVDIFHRHARSREAKLQVEIARLAYVAPRMRETGGGQDRQRGGIGGKGAGESSLELDRRKIRDRIAELRQELAAIQRDQDQRRKHRREARRVALVGYTNAGKSSLMRALTGSEVLVEDKLFATLDTTVRALTPEVRPRILVSDTVGFIKKLPHDLVASFKSTLDEALEASLLLYVVDASDPTHESQLAVTRQVLADIGADVVPSKLVLNKLDRLDDEQRAKLAEHHPEALLLSAKRPDDVATLRSAIIDFFDQSLEEATVFVPWSSQSIVHLIHEGARVVATEYLELGVELKIRTDAAMLARIRAALGPVADVGQVLS